MEAVVVGSLPAGSLIRELPKGGSICVRQVRSCCCLQQARHDGLLGVLLLRNHRPHRINPLRRSVQLQLGEPGKRFAENAACSVSCVEERRPWCWGMLPHWCSASFRSKPRCLAIASAPPSLNPRSPPAPYLNYAPPPEHRCRLYRR